MTRGRWEQILFAHVGDEVVQDMLNQYVLELESSNAKLRELLRDMLPFAEVGMDDACVTRRCCLYEQCEYVVGVKCTIEQHMLDRMRELRIEVDE